MNDQAEAFAVAERRIARSSAHRSLDLSGLGLESLPETLEAMPHLTELNLSGNRLTQLPAWFSHLSGLTRLDLGRNALADVPDPVARLTQLRFLALDGNRLTSVPDWIYHLKQLQFLTLGDNRLTNLPMGLGLLPRLTSLDLAGNPDLQLPGEVIESGTAAVLTFLRARKGGVEPRWHSKVLVVGEGQVGKTSLVKALAGEPHDQGEPTTHGMRIRELHLPHPRQQDITMHLSFWDFGGQDIYHATHQFFLTDRSLFLLVWSPRLGHDHSRVRYWLDIITARAPTAPIVLVATQSASLPPDLPLQELMRGYPRIVGSWAIDCDPRTGIEQLRAAIATEASRLPLMGLNWPRAWTEVSRWIHSVGDPYISIDRLNDIMASAGIVLPDEQAELALVLTHLGEILHYPDDENLADMVVTWPGWINGRISKILESEPVVARRGLLTRDDIAQEWSDIPPNWREKFLYLMEKFDISYRVDDPAGSALAVVVERLPWDPPHYERRWQEALAALSNVEIRIQYRLSVMPPGIPTWFIARSHRFATDAHWRTGALLRHHDGLHHAVITADNDEKTVDLIVRGPMPAAFFGTLDDGLNVTFDRYPGLRITRLIPCPCQPNGACTEQYEYEKLLRRLMRGRSMVVCPESDIEIEIKAILSGIKPTTRGGEAANTDLTLVLEAIKQGFSEARSDSDLNQLQFMRLQTLLRRQQEIRCPSVFAISRAENDAVLAKRYVLRLYCEQPGEWHPLPGGQGCYPIVEPREWVRRFGPHLQRTLAILKEAAPFASGLLGVLARELHGQLQNDVKHMKELLKEIPGSVSLPSESFSELVDLKPAGPRAWAETDADFRMLEAQLVELDPLRGWGGLSRIVTPEGQMLFVCPAHLQSYRSVAPMPAIRR